LPVDVTDALAVRGAFDLVRPDAVAHLPAQASVPESIADPPTTFAVNTTADLVVGTSAGSVAGAQILSGVALEKLYDAQLREPKGEIPANLGRGKLLRFMLMMAWPGDEGRARARLGRAAMKADTIPESMRLQVIASRLPSTVWPDRTLLITAVNAETGELRVFDRASGVPLLEAVAASCAVPLVFPPITVGGRRYVDGGVGSPANADLATGCDTVIVIAPVTMGLRRSQRLSHQLGGLGPDVRSVVVSPDAAARQAMGRRPLDPAFRAAAARAGHAQASKVASPIRDAWSVPTRARAGSL